MDRMLDRKLTPTLRKTFAQESRELRKALSQALYGQRGLTVSRQHVKAVEAALAARMPGFGRLMSAALADQTRETQAEAVRSLGKFMGALRREGTRLDDPRVFESIIRTDRKLLKEQRRDSGKQLVFDTTHEIRQSLKVLPKDAKVRDLIEQVHAKFEEQWWRVERTMRTETSRAFNTTQDTAFDELGEEFPGIYRRWTELVSDLTGAPLDNRVGKDSLVLHGQVAKPGKPFRMPAHPLAPSYMVGKSWLCPPNRPNDRAVLTPWFAGSGVPAWTIRGGERVSLK